MSGSHTNGPASGPHIRPRASVLHLVARGTGRRLRLNGQVLTVLARDIEAARLDMMGGRDPRLWTVEVIDAAQRHR